MSNIRVACLQARRFFNAMQEVPVNVCSGGHDSRELDLRVTGLREVARQATISSCFARKKNCYYYSSAWYTTAWSARGENKTRFVLCVQEKYNYYNNYTGV